MQNDMTMIDTSTSRAGRAGRRSLWYSFLAAPFGMEQSKVLSLSQFYIDKYEVTTKLYAVLLKHKLSRRNGGNRRKALTPMTVLSLVSLAGQPAVACLYYGKRCLPEQGWEKQRGDFDARRYPTRVVACRPTDRPTAGTGQEAAFNRQSMQIG